MQFGLNWNDGYEVTVIMPNEHGFVCHQPLRNFGHRQGDARIFKEVDCPQLTYAQIRMLVRSFDRSVKYERINGRKFVKQ